MSLPRLESLLIAANIRLGYESREATEHAQALIRVISDHYAGETIYIGQQPKTAERDQLILKAFEAGATMRRIARKWGLSVSSTHDAIRRAKRSVFQLENRTRADAPSAHPSEPHA